MALILCPECGKEISDKASACPHCGHPCAATEDKKSKGTTLGRKVTVFIIMLSGFVIFWAIIGGIEDSNKKQEEAGPVAKNAPDSSQPRRPENDLVKQILAAAPPPEYLLVSIDAGGGRGDEITITRFRFLLGKVHQATDESPRRRDADTDFADVNVFD